jgi:hypothetical protein
MRPIGWGTVCSTHATLHSAHAVHQVLARLLCMGRALRATRLLGTVCLRHPIVDLKGGEINSRGLIITDTVIAH